MKVADRLAVRHAAWHVGTVVSVAPETPNARRIVLDVPTWPGNDAGAHLDIRLTAPDGYQASRAYSIASATPAATAGDGADGDADAAARTRVVLAVDRLEYGEVSPFLVDELRAGDQLELHGPLGAFFIWKPPPASDPAPPAPVQLIAAGSGIVPLAAMVQAHVDAGDATRFRLNYSVRDPAHLFFRSELADAVAAGALDLDPIYTREAPPDALRVPGRITKELLAETTIPPHEHPRIYVCGPTPFVEMVLMWLLELGHEAAAIRAERFGGAA